MAGFFPFDLVDLLSPPSFSYFESSISAFPAPFAPPPSALLVNGLHRHRLLDHAFDLLSPTSFFHPDLLPPSAIDFHSAADHAFAFDRSSFASFKRLSDQADAELCLRDLSDRVTALELGRRARAPDLDRKYTCTAELGLGRKYKWTATDKAGGERAVKYTAEIKGAEESEGFDRKFVWAAEAKGAGKRNLKWSAEFKGKGRHSPLSRTYTWQTLTNPHEEEEKSKKEKNDKKGKKENAGTVHVVEIEEKNPGPIAIRKAFTNRCAKGKQKELTRQDAALLIQMTFRAHLARRSQVLHCLRELAVAKSRLKDIRALFYNFSYRRRIASDAEELQRFTEKIIVLLLTVEGIEGPDYMVRAAKKSMVDELEAMMEAVDPQPATKLASMKRRKFDLPDGGQISKEMMEGVAEVVQMLDEE
ncbi:BAG family molecular chaperone regulator 7-like isoform X1 [Zingiber officinale]|uniref:BAG family molecular chaperone regulator 7 n=1 Tax=Zingiber officinale TaxID=94328 RepID=A0A8J5FBT8_ZINOF|nr:BAG family molecular chaperone regulator 7-like isoform X1 [Zingiber officinale]KAG6480379.1 hypothetical protein ZIOFF_063879 [Zingiber officinale]